MLISENPQVIFFILLGISILFALSYIKKRDHKNIKKNLESKGFKVLKIKLYKNAYKHFPQIPGNCYYVTYENKERKAFVGYCFCSMTDPVTWVQN